MRERVIKSLFYLVGLGILSVGISMMLVADLGAGPWDALYVGLSWNIGLTVGSWIFIIGFLLILINGYLLKKKPDFSAVLTIFLIGVLIDFWLLVVFRNVEPGAVPAQAGMLISGIVLIAIGVSFYLQIEFARNPIDNLMMAVQYRTGKSMSVSKTVIEVSVLIVAFLLGGPIGIGTVLVAFGIGPLIQAFYKPVSSIKSRLIHEGMAS
ncbi:YczE/YyaS/YitT family protein [Salsuginibacillus kocurii]|uniref:YczE/YyaS/YitT family protein n=1 Tax=Salsuginibacillus kocurii TaxID=427078 RepID=UPI00036998D7|nr:hypothetical protein [Salsuginibacillus kocurii]